MQDPEVQQQLIEFEADRNRRESLEHRDVLLAIAAIIKTDEGKRLFRYLFKTLDVTSLPPDHMDGKILYEYLGFLKAGLSIYKLVCEAASETGASIIAKIERERYEDKLQQFRIESGYLKRERESGSESDD
jgi:hypothetical protein